MIQIGIRCDADQRTGVGHLVRCLALAEALADRDARLLLLGEVETVPWVSDQVSMPVFAGATTPAAMVAQAHALSLDALVIDSYDLDPACAGAVRAAGITTMVIVDGDSRGQDADLYLDQNLDAESIEVPIADGARRLAGVSYALLRRGVTDLRPSAPRFVPPGLIYPGHDDPQPATSEPDGPPHVVCVFGGTDAFGAAPVMAQCLIDTESPLRATVVSAGRQAEIAALPAGAGQSLTGIDPTPDLPQLLSTADLVVSAAGTSIWELLCLGVPTALVCVVDNQQLGYDRATARGLAAGLGHLDRIRAGGGAAATQTLRELLSDIAVRATLGSRGWTTVDGQGRDRVADALLDLVASRALTPA